MVDEENNYKHSTVEFLIRKALFHWNKISTKILRVHYEFMKERGCKTLMNGFFLKETSFLY